MILRLLADRDPLTGAINRRALRDIFNEVQTSGAMLLFFDLDGFKQINDVHGHAAGDDCLRIFANALKESFRPDDQVVRYGGDEFLVIARGLDAEAARTRIEDLTRAREAECRPDLVRILRRHIGARAWRAAGCGAADRRSEHVQGEEPGPLIDLDCAGPCVRAIIRSYHQMERINQKDSIERTCH